VMGMTCMCLTIVFVIFTYPQRFSSWLNESCYRYHFIVVFYCVVSAVYPDRPCHIAGQNLSFVCTAPLGFSSTSLDFKWVRGSEQIPHQGHMQLKNETSVELSIPHLPRNLSGWHLSCFVNESIQYSTEIIVVEGKVRKSGLDA
jgi:hypothetical protein